MCYTGKCKYENYLGGCKINDSNYPEDAACTMGEFDGVVEGHELYGTSERG